MATLYKIEALPGALYEGAQEIPMLIPSNNKLVILLLFY